jgi:hypothetical protein
MSVSRRAERATVPRLGPVERVSAAWIVCVDVGEGGGAIGLLWGNFREIEAGRK